FITTNLDLEEWKNALNILKQIWDDEETKNLIKKEYYSAFSTKMDDNLKLLKWCYLVKRKKIPIEKLIEEEAKTYSPEYEKERGKLLAAYIKSEIERRNREKEIRMQRWKSAIEYLRGKVKREE
ncbi:MAG: hypothetical protein J7L54_03895, partial [Elusimicrobia bacterium]|nr:hypothetical protein [Elusimicrobiota bacterium]